MTTRKYSSRSQQTTLSGGLTSSGTSATVISGSSLLGGITVSAGETFTIVIDPDTALEEIVDVTATSGNTFTITRAIDGSTGQAHSAGAIVRHMAIGRDYRETNTHIENTTTAHGITLANLIKTSDTGTVTSTMILDGTIVNADVNASAAIAYSKLNLTGGVVSNDLANDTIVDADINTAAAIAWTKIAPSSTVSATELGYLDGVTSAVQTQIDAKLATATAASTYAPLASPALTGVPTAPTAAANTNTTQVATTAYVQTELSDLLASAPAALDTLNELAAALGNDPSFATTVSTSIATKLPKAGGTMTGAIDMGTTNKITSLATPTVSTDAATKGYVDTVTVAPSNLTGVITSVGPATSIASQTGTGTKFVVDTSPTLVTPVLGVATATSVNGTTIPTSKTLVVTTDKISALSATTSSELAGVISDETGSGALVFGTSPTIASPKISSTYTAKTAAYTFASGDEGGLFSMNNAASVQFNIPTDATFNFAVGTEINVFWITGAGQPTIGAVTPGTTTVISTGGTSATPKLRVANSGATIKKLAANSWIVFGDLA